MLLLLLLLLQRHCFGTKWGKNGFRCWIVWIQGWCRAWSAVSLEFFEQLSSRFEPVSVLLNCSTEWLCAMRQAAKVVALCSVIIEKLEITNLKITCDVWLGFDVPVAINNAGKQIAWLILTGSV